MNMNRIFFAQSLIIAGGSVLTLGVFLLLIKLVMLIAWYAAGIVALVGLVVLLVGFLLRRA